METISSIRDLINLWPTRSSLVADLHTLSPGMKVTTARVHKWAENGSIPAKYHSSILEAGQKRGFSISAELIVELHAPRTRGLAPVL